MLESFDYDVTPYDIRAADFGVPQLCHRVFVVATLPELDLEYELHESHSPSE